MEKLIIGSRGSKLALKYAEIAKKAFFKELDIEIEIKKIKIEIFIFLIITNIYSQITLSFEWCHSSYLLIYILSTLPLLIFIVGVSISF